MDGRFGAAPTGRFERPDWTGERHLGRRDRSRRHETAASQTCRWFDRFPPKISYGKEVALQRQTRAAVVLNRDGPNLTYRSSTLTCLMVPVKANGAASL